MLADFPMSERALDPDAPFCFLASSGPKASMRSAARSVRCREPVAQHQGETTGLIYGSSQTTPWSVRC